MRKLFNNVLKKYLLKGGDKKPPVVDCSVTGRVRGLIGSLRGLDWTSSSDLKVAPLDFLGSIPAHFERLLRRKESRLNGV